MSQLADFDIAYSKPNWCPGCVVPSTIIQTNPSSTPVTNLKEQDKVIASDGRVHTITKAYEHMHDGIVYRLVSKYFGNTTLTPEHPVLAVRRKHNKLQNKEYHSEWIEAADLRKGDYLLYPILKEEQDRKKVPLPIVKRKKDTRSKQIPGEIEVTGDFIRLAGYYIAEGYVHRRAICFTFHKDEQAYVTDVVHCAKKVFGLTATPIVREKKHTCDVTFNSSYLAELFEQWFGKGAANKKIPDFLMFLPKFKQAELIKGLWRGDGCVNRKTHRASYKTISKVLCEQLKMLLLRQGILPTITVEQDHGMHKTAYAIFVNELHDFSVLTTILQPDDDPIAIPLRRRQLITPEYAYLPIKKIEKKSYSGPVYNLEVETENAYVTENAILHNCGDFGIWVAIKNALVELGVKPQNILLVSGIGCSSKVPYWVNVYGFNGLHGRPLPVATAAKLANHELTVITQAGDGDQYSEGGNHLLHAMKRNIDICHLVHDNQVYGLTVNESSATTEKGAKTRSQPHGTIEKPLNPLQFALAAGATFVARGFAGDTRHLINLIVEGVKHKGFAFIDILQPCVTYNHINTFQYFFRKVYKLEEENWQPTDKVKAFEKAQEWEERIPLGIFYKTEEPTLDSQFPQIKETPLVKQPVGNVDISKLMEEFV